MLILNRVNKETKHRYLLPRINYSDIHLAPRFDNSGPKFEKGKGMHDGQEQ